MISAKGMILARVSAKIGIRGFHLPSVHYHNTIATAIAQYRSGGEAAKGGIPIYCYVYNTWVSGVARGRSVEAQLSNVRIQFLSHACHVTGPVDSLYGVPPFEGTFTL